MRKYLPYVPGILILVIVLAFTFCQPKMNPEWLGTEYPYIGCLKINEIGWDHEFEKIVLKPDNSALREYYEGIHLCRVGYEKVSQEEIEKIKFLLQ